MSNRRYPVVLTQKELRIIDDALSLFYMACEDDISEEVDGLSQRFSQLAEMTERLEPIYNEPPVL